MNAFSRHFVRQGLLWFGAVVFLFWGPLARPVSSGDVPRHSKRDRLATVLEVLSHVPTGKELLGRAQRFWGLSRPEAVKTVLRWGSSSRTDAVLTRHFNSQTGEETREREVTIYLREDQGLDDIVLDLAHELVHATTRPSWDPYDPKLTAGRYIWAAIEGEGGEVDAVSFECRVGFELFDRYGAAGSSTQRCRGYLGASASAQLDRVLIKQDFYRVGKWKDQLQRDLGAEQVLFPQLSGEAPKLYSSTGNAPYPIALYREFQDITAIACENTRKRADAAEGQGRSPASNPKSATRFIAERCDRPQTHSRSQARP